ncbi:MAG: hypothetical protein ACXWV9_04590 [Flavisolibacter sp.]
MNKWIILSLVLLLLSCKSKKETEEKTLVSVVSLIQAQVKMVDTSLYRITMIQKIDSTADTSIISREDFRIMAKDFLTLPDISSEKMKESYDESNSYDKDMELALFTYTANDPEVEIRRETIMLEPNPTGGESKVKSILINSIRSDKDSTIEKDLTWHMNNRFQVVSKIRKTNQPEKIRILQVRWE